MSSSSSRRISSACESGKLSMTNCRDELNFFCRTTESTHKNGFLDISSPIAEILGKILYGPVGLHLPNGAVFVGQYNKELKRIEGLAALMKDYDVKIYQILSFKHYGGTEFRVEIFNQYAVEIYYAPRVEFVGKNVVSANDSSGRMIKMADYETDKLHASFSFNAYTTFSAERILEIKKEHLVARDWNLVLCKDATSELELDSNTDWLEFGFKKYMWRIELKWENGNVFFDRQWNTFAEAANLSVGDRLMLMRSTHFQIFGVAVFGRETLSFFKKPVVYSAKGLQKWFKIMNWESAVIGDVELPLLFAEQYGEELKEDVNMFLPDSGRFHAYFSRPGNLLYGLKKLMETYNVKEKYVMFFEYVGVSSFYVTIFTEEGEDIFRNLEEKLMLTTLLGEFGCDNKTDHHVNRSTKSAHEDFSVRQWKRNNFPADVMPYFSVVLLKSHVDHRGHGVYIAKHLSPIFRSWNKNTEINLVMGRKRTTVAVLRRKKTCRFGVGWNSFTLQNNLKVGQKLKFSYVEGNTFEVTIVR